MSILTPCIPSLSMKCEATGVVWPVIEQVSCAAALAQAHYQFTNPATAQKHATDIKPASYQYGAISAKAYLCLWICKLDDMATEDVQGTDNALLIGCACRSDEQQLSCTSRQKLTSNCLHPAFTLNCLNMPSGESHEHTHADHTSFNSARWLTRNLAMPHKASFQHPTRHKMHMLKPIH